MRTRGHSPLIILFDLLFMLLFVSVLQQEQVLTIRLPPQHLPKDVQVVVATNAQELNQQAIAIANASTAFGFFLPCSGQIECKDLGQAAKIILPMSLYHKISQLATASFVDGVCHRLTLHIRSNALENAVLDYQRLGKDNPCLFKINGFKIWLTVQQNL